MLNGLIILMGGGLGALCRYLFTGFAGFLFPWQIITINYLGSFLMGFFYELFKNYVISASIKKFIFIGFLGAFTTFSSYSLDAVRFFVEGKYKQGFIYIFLGNLTAIGATLIGIFCVKFSRLLFK